MGTSHSAVEVRGHFISGSGLPGRAGGAAAAVEIGGAATGGELPADGRGLAAWEGTSVGTRSDFGLPGHLYLQFSAQPPSTSFGAYSDWYQVHQDENIAQSDVLRRGGVSLLRAHVSESPQRYSAFGPYLEKGGPPPRVAFVASVAAVVG